MFPIGDFAALTGVSSKRLRHYDAIGLFRPAHVDPSSRYRFYTATQIPELRRIVALRNLGIPLRTIGEIAVGGQAALQAALDARRAEVLAEQDRLARNLAALDIVLAGAEGLDVVVRTRPAGRWASARRTLAPSDDLSELFVVAERHVRDERRRARQPPVAVYHGPERGGRKDVEVLIPITGRLGPHPDVVERTTPSTLVGTLLRRGEYPSLESAHDVMTTWARAAGYRLTGPVWLVYLRFSAEAELAVPAVFLADDADFVTEVQAPIEPASAEGSAQVSSSG